jgi:hypothetical protein
MFIEAPVKVLYRAVQAVDDLYELILTKMLIAVAVVWDAHDVGLPMSSTNSKMKIAAVIGPRTTPRANIDGLNDQCMSSTKQ